MSCCGGLPEADAEPARRRHSTHTTLLHSALPHCPACLQAADPHHLGLADAAPWKRHSPAWEFEQMWGSCIKPKRTRSQVIMKTSTRGPLTDSQLVLGLLRFRVSVNILS